MTGIGKAAVAGSAVLVAAGGLATTALGGADASAVTKKISVLDNYFAQVGKDENANSTTIEKGDSVSFRWSESNSAPHDVSFTKVPDGVRKKNSGEAVAQRSKFNYTPPKTGTYRYVCTIHVSTDSMKGKIIVKKQRLAPRPASGFPRPCTVGEWRR